MTIYNIVDSTGNINGNRLTRPDQEKHEVKRDLWCCKKKGEAMDIIGIGNLSSQDTSIQRHENLLKRSLN